MPPILKTIGRSWDFFRTQPAITYTGFWLLFLPMLGDGLLAEYELRFEEQIQSRPEMLVLVMLSYLLLSLLAIGGTVCVLTVGKRMLQAKSGRARTSPKAVWNEARGHFLPYLLTSILRGIFTFLWSLLLIIPGIIYSVRTVFYPVIVVSEGLAYREALNRSKEAVQGQFWSVLWSVIITAFLTFAPAFILSGLAQLMADGAPPFIILAATIIQAIALSLATILFHLSLIQLYGHFKPKGHVTNR